MTAEVDPWALSRRTPIAVAAPTPSSVRMNRLLGFAAVVLSALYVLACVVEIFIAHSQTAFAGTLDNIFSDGSVTRDEVNQDHVAARGRQRSSSSAW